jgi:hypothetical protein
LDITEAAATKSRGYGEAIILISDKAVVSFGFDKEQVKSMVQRQEYFILNTGFFQELKFKIRVVY